MQAQPFIKVAIYDPELAFVLQEFLWFLIKVFLAHGLLNSLV